MFSAGEEVYPRSWGRLINRCILLVSIWWVCDVLGGQKMNMIRKNTGKEMLECSNCFDDIKPGKNYAVVEDDSILCMECFDFAYPKCEFCGERVSEDDMKYWGDCYCCPDCYEKFCPSFDPDENEKETTDAYKAMLKRYIGKKTDKYRNESVDLESEYDDCGLVTYRLTVDIDEEGKIHDISRLTAEILLSESEKSSSWDDYIIRNEDYEDKVDAMMLDMELE